jgi:guanyl-specific ribonuclease Sa
MKKKLRFLPLLLCLLLCFCTACSDADLDTALNLAGALLSDSSQDEEDTAHPDDATTEADPGMIDRSSYEEGTSASGSAAQSASVQADPNAWLEGIELDEEGTYSSQEDVAAYLVTYHHLPENYITKKQAQKLGWEGGSLERYAPGKCIGGSRFGNYEGKLPDDTVYYECDIDTLGAKKRGAKRLVYSEGCETVYYTDDHYETFTLLYGEE